MEKLDPLYNAYKTLTIKQLSSISSTMRNDNTGTLSIDRVSTKGLELFPETNEILNQLQKIETLMNQLDKMIAPAHSGGFLQVMKRAFIDKFIDRYIERYQLEFDDRYFDEIFLELKNYITGSAKYYYYAPVSNLEPEDEDITFGDCHIRKASQKEHRDIFGNMGLEARLRPTPTKGYYIIEHFRSNYVLNEMRSYLQERIEILNLFTKDLIQVPYVTCKLPLFYPVESSASVEVINARSGVPMLGTLTKEDCARFIDFYNLLAKIQDSGRVMFAIKRYGYGRAARIIEDKAVDFVMALEALLTNSDKEIADKLSLRTAVLNRKEPSESLKIRNFMKKAYNVRSKIVHGDHGNLAKAINSIEDLNRQWPEQLEEITRDSIVHVVNLLTVEGNLQSVGELLDEALIDPAKRETIWNKSRVLSLD